MQRNNGRGHQQLENRVKARSSLLRLALGLGRSNALEAQSSQGADSKAAGAKARRV
jgi:hypothetical protein